MADKTIPAFKILRGNVGINTATPAFKIDVDGSAVFRGAASWAGNDNQNASIYLSTAGYGLHGNFANYARNLVRANSQYVEVGQNSTLVYGVKFIVGSNAPNGFMFQSNVSGSMITHMSIRGDTGNVGIGTVGPAQKLHVAGSTLISNNNYHHGYTAAGAQVTLIGIKSNNYITVGQNNVNHVGTNIFGGTGIIDFSTGGSTRMTLTSAGNVGIGTVNAPHLLTLKGDGKYFAAYASDGSIAVQLGSDSSGDGNFILYDHSGGTKVKLYAESGGANYINNGGNFAIGTSSASRKLTVQGGSGDNLPARIIAGASTTTCALEFQDPDTTADYKVTMGSVGDNMFFQAGGSERVRIKSDGNVGIGTNAPGVRFHLVGAAGTVNSLATSVSAATMRIQHNSASSLSIFSGNTTSSETYFQATNYNGTTAYVIALNPYGGSVGIGTNAPDSLLMVYKSGADSIIHVRGASNGGDARVRINGYNSSELYLDRNGSGRFAFRRTTGTDDLSLLALNSNYSDNSTIMFWDYSHGSVGIGTVSPSDPLHVVGYIKSSIGFKAASYTTMLESGNESVFGNTAYYGVLFKTNNATRMKITNAGLVGIGTVSPSAQLQIGRSQTTSAFTDSFIKLRPSNTTNASGLTSITFGTSTVDNYGYSISGWRAGTDGSPYLRIKRHNNSASGDDVMVMNNLGNVGISTTNPAYKFEVKASVTGNWLSRIYNTATSGNSSGLLVRMDESASTGIAFGVYANGGYKFRVEPDGETQILSGSAYTTHLNYQNSGTHYITMANGGATYFRGSSNSITTMTVLGTGSVGIGGTPSAALDIFAANASSIAIRIVGGNKVQFLNAASNTNANIYNAGSTGNSDLTFQISGTSMYTMTSGSLYPVANGTKDLGLSGNRWNNVYSDTAIFGAAATKLKTYSDSTYSGIYNGSSLGSDEAIYFGSGTTYFVNDGSSSLVIDSNQRVQLKGTDYQLQYVSGSHIWYTRLTSGGTFAIHKNGVGDYLSVTSAGNVGIGTNAPEAALTVADSTVHQAIFRTAQTTASERAGGGFSSVGSSTATSRYARLFLDADGANFSGTDYFTIEKFGSSGVVKFLQYSNANMSFWVNTSTEALTIWKNGNVGVGTNTPNGLLNVAGNTKIGTAGSPYSGTNITSLTINGVYPVLSLGNTSNRFTILAYSSYTNYETVSNAHHVFSGGNVGISTTSPAATLDVKQGTATNNNKLMKVADDVLSVYKVTGLSNHTVTLTCGSYFQAEVVITANQTNGGTYNNLYIRGIWSNNHYSHHWDEIENIGSLSGSSFSIAVSANDVSNSGKLVITHTYSSGSFSQMVVRVTDLYGSAHSYSIT